MAIPLQILLEQLAPVLSRVFERTLDVREVETLYNALPATERTRLQKAMEAFLSSPDNVLPTELTPGALERTFATTGTPTSAVGVDALESARVERLNAPAKAVDARKFALEQVERRVEAMGYEVTDQAALGRVLDKFPKDAKEKLLAGASSADDSFFASFDSHIEDAITGNAERKISGTRGISKKAAQATATVGAAKTAKAAKKAAGELASPTAFASLLGAADPMAISTPRAASTVGQGRAAELAGAASLEGLLGLEGKAASGAVASTKAARSIEESALQSLLTGALPENRKEAGGVLKKLVDAGKISKAEAKTVGILLQEGLGKGSVEELLALTSKGRVKAPGAAGGFLKNLIGAGGSALGKPTAEFAAGEKLAKAGIPGFAGAGAGLARGAKEALRPRNLITLAILGPLIGGLMKSREAVQDIEENEIVPSTGKRLMTSEEILDKLHSDRALAQRRVKLQQDPEVFNDVARVLAGGPAERITTSSEIEIGQVLSEKRSKKDTDALMNQLIAQLAQVDRGL